MTLRVAVEVHGNSDGAVTALTRVDKSVRALSGVELDASVAAQKAANAFRVNTAAAQANAAAMQAQAAAACTAGNQHKLLAFQLNDVFVSLASGMNPMMVAMQQGSQMAQIYGPGEGGLGKAITESGKMILGLAAKFAPVLAVAGLFTAAIGGMSAAIEHQTGVNVSWGDTALAAVQVIAGGIYSVLQPAIGKISEWFQQAMDFVLPILHTVGNAIIGTSVGAFDATKATWSALPAVLGDVVVSAANAVIDAINAMLNQGRLQLYAFVKQAAMALNVLPGGGALVSAAADALLPAGPIRLPGIQNPNTGAAARAGADIAAAFGDAFKTDYIGEFFGAVSQQAVRNFNERLAETGKTAERTGKDLKQLATEGMQAVLDSARDMASAIGGTLKGAWNGFFSDLFKNTGQFESVWDKIAAAAANAIGKIADQMLELTTSSAFNALFGSVGSGKTKGSGLGGMLADLIAGLFSEAGSPTAPKFGTPVYRAGIGHTGAIIGHQIETRYHDAALFSNAQRFHQGKLGPKERPFIGLDGEEIGRKYQGNGGDLHITVNNNHPTGHVRVQRVGGRRAIVTFDEAVAGALARMKPAVIRP